MMSGCIISLPHLASASVVRLPSGHDVWLNMQLLAQRDKWLFPEATRPVEILQLASQIRVLMGDGSEGGHSDPPEGLQTSTCWQLLLRNLLALGSPTPNVPKYSKPPEWSSLECFFCWRITRIDKKCCSTTLECEIGALSSAKSTCDSTWPREKTQRSVNIRFRRAPPRHTWLNLITFNLKTACVSLPEWPIAGLRVWSAGRLGGEKGTPLTWAILQHLIRYWWEGHRMLIDVALNYFPL